MKKTASILLLIAMLMSVIPFSAVTVSAAVSENWKDNYSLAWYDENTELADATTTAPADTSTYAEVGGKYYKVQGYTSATFIIDSAEDLAGLAVLTNARKTDPAKNNNTTARANPFFANCTFYITKDIDLTGRYWTPLAFDHHSGYYYFGGNLIGNMGGASNGNGGSVTIKGMTVNITDNSKNYGAALIGCQAGGSVKNIDLVNASVTSAAPFAAASFVARQSGLPYADESIRDTRSQTVYENLSSDAVIVKTSTTEATNNVAGGIVGVDANGVYQTKYTNCVFTGTIDNQGNKSGGLVGFGENGTASTGGKNYASAIYFTDCIVTSPSITAMTTADANKFANRGAGGLIGVTKTAVYADGCYVSAVVHSGASASVTVGGMVGRTLIEQPISFVDCHFDGLVYAENWDFNAAFIGATSAATANDVIFRNCLNTGVAMNSTGTLKGKGLPWMGYVSTSNNKGYKFTFENCYSSCNSLYVLSLQNNTITAISVNGTEIAKAAEITALAPAVASIADVRGKALFTSSKWTARSGMYPTIYEAYSYADTKYATADYSWFDYKAVGATTPVVIDDLDELYALSKISKACSTKHTFASFVSEYNIKISPALEAAVTEYLFTSADIATLGNTVGVTKDSTVVKDLFAQKGTESGSTYSARVGAQIKGSDWDKASFEYYITYVDAYGVKYSSVIDTVEVAKCYTSILANGTPVDADSGYYYVVFVISGLDTSWTNVEVSFTVSVEADGVATYGSAETCVVA